MITATGIGVPGHSAPGALRGTQAGAAGVAPAAPGANPTTAPAAAPARVLSDDEILGIDLSVKPRGSAAPTEPTDGAKGGAASPQNSVTEELQEMLAEVAEPAELQDVFAANPELRQAWRAEKAYREVFPTVETG